MTNPSCDRHKNLQMTPFSLDYRSGKISGYVCPVPTCGHFWLNRPEEGYDSTKGICVQAFWAQTEMAPCKPYSGTNQN